MDLIDELIWASRILIIIWIALLCLFFFSCIFWLAEVEILFVWLLFSLKLNFLTEL